MELKRYT